MAARAIGVRLNHIARESSDVKRLAAFYQEVLGFESIESPNYRDFEVIWLRLSPDVTLHLIERHHPESKIPEGTHVSPPASVVTDPRVLPRSHHVCFGVSNYDDFVQSLKACFSLLLPSPRFCWIKNFDSSDYGCCVLFCFRREGFRPLRRRSLMGRPDKSSSLILTYPFDSCVISVLVLGCPSRP
ncbi:hypothetical protein KSP39_PZI021025 [Platanthera zijinensis]|uniref:VOC domain-containing protein n=1 Tax=Platanthera zijinensis TaxID=2320716 RepID=A0AAP0FWU8_9ASPA